MSYDFYAEVDTGGSEKHHIEPYFADAHPVIGANVAGNVMVTESGYARCGNYTSNVSGIWARCLTEALDRVPDARQWVGADARAFNATGRTVSRRNADGEWVSGPMEASTDRLLLQDLNGVRMGDLVPLLQAAVEWGVDHIDLLHEFDPDNGWGDADGAVTYLWDIQRFCEQHPNATLYLSF